jgi:hypothetical protein
MTGPKILVQDAGRPRLAPAPDFGWYLLGWIGVVFTFVGGLDLLLTWYPPRFGNAEWEFGTVSASLDGLPVLTLGLALTLGAAAARGQRWLLRSLTIVLLILATLIGVWAVLYATNIPIALQAVTDPSIRTGLKKAIAKAAGQSVLYPVAFVWLAIVSWRRSSAK